MKRICPKSGCKIQKSTASKNSNYLSGCLCAVLTLLFFVCQPAAASLWQDDLFDSYGLEVNGFVEARAGMRVRQDLLEKDASIAEGRLQIDLSKDLGWGVFSMKGDVVGDQVVEKVTAELRKATLLFSPADFVDVKAGRQVLTWGTGDMIFINDMFPKDWQSFFTGRDDEYLKFPSDALKASVFFDSVNINLVYVPVFNPSQYVSGDRLSFYNNLTSSFAGREAEMHDDERISIEDSEYHMRLSKNISGTEVAAYAYSGFWKEPEGFDATRGLAMYPRLSVYGASARAAILSGIGSVEVGYYDSRRNRSGDNPFSRNSESRFMAGFEKELAEDFTGAVQYYVELMDDYDAYERSNLAMGAVPVRDEFRHMVTLRLTKLLLDQNLTLSLFTYFSPSDHDGYSRPRASYRINDNWKVEGGGNFFWGKQDYSFWGRFKKNNNIFTALRYSF